MADEAVNEEETPKSGGKLKIILMVVGVLVLLGAAVGGTIFYMQSTTPPPAVEGEAEGGEAAEETDSGFFGGDGLEEAIYHKLRPNFITTFEANNKQRYMQLEVTLMTRDSEVISALIKHDPLIRNQLVLLFSQQDYIALQTPDGKAELKKASLTTVQSILQKEIGKSGIDAVLFTNLVMQ